MEAVAFLNLQNCKKQKIFLNKNCQYTKKNLSIKNQKGCSPYKKQSSELQLQQTQY